MPRRPVDRIRHHVTQRDAALQPGGQRHAVHVVAHQDAAQFLEHQDQAVGHQHLLQVVAVVQVAEERRLQEVAQHRGQHHAHGKRGDEAAAQPAVDHRPQRKRHIGADHVETAVGKIDDAHAAEDQRFE
ncbi:hypothetical protein G6F23_013985 [Rhizopus arrhizus]|nr:hypothetical protein G6F23_013985 [Rhizopus arrhizus]